MDANPGASRIAVGGSDLEYRWWGPGPDAAPTFVLLHEGLGSVGLWRDFPAALADRTGWGVVAYSRAGYGMSGPAKLPRPLDYMTREAVDVLPEVLDGLGVGPCAFLGHSDGATIAAIHAGTVRDARLSGAVLIAPHFFTEDMGLAEIALATEAFEAGELRERLARHHADPDIAFRGWSDAWLDPGFREWDVSGVIDGIAVPVLAIQGRDDPYGTLAQIEVIRRRCPAPVDVCLLSDCGHGPHLERPGETLKAVAAFASRLTPTGATA